ncbi:MAG: hypothetical protein ACKVZJ_10535 [Phycisphaerales bacterium]
MQLASRLVSTTWLAMTALGAPAALGAVTPFELNRIDAGGIPGGSLGNPITWSPAHAAYNPVFGGNIPPSPQGIAGNAALGFDSYLALDPIGPSTAASCTTCSDGYTASGPSNILFPTATPTTPFGVGSLSGVWFNAGTGGGWVSSGPQSRVFIAQVTLLAGTPEPTTLGIIANIRDAGTLSPTGELGTLKFGAANASNNNGLWGQSYYLEVEQRLGPSIFPISPPASAFVYAIYVRAIPAPGVGVAVALAGGVLAFRRRR